MVKLTDEQKRELEALRNMPDDKIDLSDIPEITEWSGFRRGLFYRPVMKHFGFKLDENVVECLKNGLSDGQVLDEAVNRSLRAQMYRIKFPVRLERAEKTIRRVQQSPEEVTELSERQIQEIEILYAMPIAEVAASRVPLKPVHWPESKGKQGQPAIKDTTLNLDENIIDWFEYGQEDGQSLDEVLNKALIDHINWVSSFGRAQHKKERAGRANDSA